MSEQTVFDLEVGDGCDWLVAVDAACDGRIVAKVQRTPHPHCGSRAWLHHIVVEDGRDAMAELARSLGKRVWELER